jgi:hypothetical protein
MLEVPAAISRPYELKVVYANVKDQQLLHVVQEFNLEHAAAIDAHQQEHGRAELNVTVQMEMACGSYVAKAFMLDAASGVSLAHSEEIEITIKASSHKYDFCYLVQAPTLFSTDHLTESSSSFAMVLQWKTQHAQPHSMFLPNSTWNQGRNALLAAARQYQCRYYIFIDEDAELVHREWDSDGASLYEPEHLGDTWREFERLLLTWQPAVAVPHAQWHRTNNLDASVAETILLFDHMVLAVSSSAIDCILPYEVRWDLDSLDYSVVPSYVVGRLLFPDRVVQFKSLSAINKVVPPMQHRTPRQPVLGLLYSEVRQSLTLCRIPATGPATFCLS